MNIAAYKEKEQLSSDEIYKIKEWVANGSADSSWSECYVATKLLCQFDVDDFDAELVSIIANKTLQKGLRYSENPDEYLEVLRYLSIIYTQFGKYELLLNCLQSIIELDAEAPDWVFHDFTVAEIHAGDIRRLLRNPSFFITDLSRNDSGSEEVLNRQRRIFSSFVDEANKYLNENSGAEVDVEALTGFAKELGADSSSEWKAFYQKCTGNQYVCSEREEQRPSKGDRPAVEEVFPEKQGTDYEKMYADAIAQVELIKKQLQEKTDELEAVRLSAERLEEENTNLQFIVSKLQSEYDEQKNQLSEKEKDIYDLQNQIILSSGDEKKKKELEKELKIARSKHLELSDKLEKLKDELTKTESRLKETNETAEEANRENVALKNELTKYIDNEEKTQAEEFLPEKVYGVMCGFLFVSLKALSSWLSKVLPQLCRDWWNICVMSSLSMEQLSRAKDNGYSKLTDFDLPSLLRVMDRNWKKYRQVTFINESEHQYLTDMFPLRNRWAHISASIPEKIQIIADLDTLDGFLNLVNGNNLEITKVRKYRSKVNQNLV